MANKLKGKIAVVTGAASGIGKGIAIRFSQEGAKVAIVDINIKEVKKVAREINKNNGKAIAIKTDITKDKQIDDTVDKVTETWGKINILVNNAGNHTSKTLLDEGVRKKWKDALDVYLTGAFLMTEAVVKKMVKNKWKGNIINITSVHSQHAAQDASYYTAAKAGLAGATKSWAKELAPYGIRVNAIAPGAIKDAGWNKKIINNKNDKLMAKKQNIPLGRHGLPGEIADAAVFLATNEYVTGHELVVDGGFLLTH